MRRRILLLGLFAMLGLVGVLGAASGSSAALPPAWDNAIEVPGSASTVTPLCAPAPPGLVSWWPGDGNANDLAGINNGTLVNGTTFAPGKVGQAFSFDGADSLVQAGTTGLPTGNSDRTLEFWTRIDSVVASEAFFAGYGTFGSFTQTYHVGATGTAPFFSQWGSGVGAPSLTTGTWHHVAVTNVGAAVRLYIDGALAGSGSLTINTPAGTQFYMGRIPGSLGDSRRLQGLVDEPAVYARALSASEIQEIFQAGSAGKCTAYAVTYDGNGADGGSAPIDGSSPHTYGTTVTALVPGSLTKTGYTFTGWNTAANGSGTTYLPGQAFSMPANDVTLYAQWTLNLLDPDTTTCDGTYAGTGTNVVVPSGATCTLSPGTHVTQDVTVSSGGTLLAKGVTIDGSLLDSGSATVCSSRIRLDVKAFAPSGPLELGGPDCRRGNKISHDVYIGRDSNDVWVWGNNIGNTLRVSNGHGATDSIIGNGVGNLLVRDSGPVVVQDNHANHGTLRCTRDSSLTGSGNTAQGTNTCPL